MSSRATSVTDRELQLGVAWPPAEDVRRAFAPLFANGTTPVLQLTVEHAFSPTLPDDFCAALDEAAARGDLIGHAVYGSPATTPRDRLTRDWMPRTRRVLERWPVRWLIDHVGCCRADGWDAAPLPLPASDGLARQMVAHLAWVADHLAVPVGLENLALAASRDDVFAQPQLVEHVLDAVDGVLLLDLHNLYCQAVNHQLDPHALLRAWPLDRVRQIHVAGGSIASTPAGPFRRDTHDGPVPTGVIELLGDAIRSTPNLEVVIYERMWGTASDPIAIAQEVSALGPHLSRPPPVSVPFVRTPLPRSEDPALQHAMFAAIRANDRPAVERLAPGWWTDDRAWWVARDLLKRWGRPVPI